MEKVGGNWFVLKFKGEIRDARGSLDTLKFTLH